MKALILAGGSGTRLWPLSRESYPKQFLNVGFKDSFLQQTVKRNLSLVNPEEIFVITNSDYFHDVARQLKEIDPLLEKNIILEPARRNTAPAIALGIKYLMENGKATPEDVIFVSPSDHLIAPLDKYTDTVRGAYALAEQGAIVTFGIKPREPEEGFGYIQRSSFEKSGGYKIEKFVEKPSRSKAEEYLKEGSYFWNSGMFAFTSKSFFRELESHAPAIYTLMDQPLAQVYSSFAMMPDISIDYAIMEKSQEAFLIPFDLDWSDVGGWENVYRALEKDQDGNAKVGESFAYETKNCLLYSEGRLVVTIGVDDLCVVESEDVVLIAKKGAAQKVKEVVGLLKKKKRREVKERRTTFRPWGQYAILEEGERFKIKRITVHPNQKLSLQKHYHRSEHWVIVKGTAHVTIEDNVKTLHEGESIFVPKSAIHRVENPGKVPLEIIEVQVGEYLGEDDIIRFEDVYGRFK